MELINVLIRTGLPTRKGLFERCLRSVYSQNYPNTRIIVSIDRECNYIPANLECIIVQQTSESFFYDKYINKLKELVTEGYFMVLDDDDILLPDVLSKMVFNSPAIIYKLNHLGRIVPPDNRVIFGMVGFPCVVLHHSLKNISDVEAENHSDYHWIMRIAEKVEFTFSDLVLVQSDQKGNGI